MSIDRQGKGEGEGAVERNTSRPTENRQGGSGGSKGSSSKGDDSTNEKVRRILNGEK